MEQISRSHRGTCMSGPTCGADQVHKTGEAEIQMDKRDKVVNMNRNVPHPLQRSEQYQWRTTSGVDKWTGIHIRHAHSRSEKIIPQRCSSFVSTWAKMGIDEEEIGSSVGVQSEVTCAYFGSNENYVCRKFPPL